MCDFMGISFLGICHQWRNIVIEFFQAFPEKLGACEILSVLFHLDPTFEQILMKDSSTPSAYYTSGGPNRPCAHNNEFLNWSHL